MLSYAASSSHAHISHPSVPLQGSSGAGLGPVNGKKKIRKHFVFHQPIEIFEPILTRDYSSFSNLELRTISPKILAIAVRDDWLVYNISYRCRSRKPTCFDMNHCRWSTATLPSWLPVLEIRQAESKADQLFLPRQRTLLGWCWIFKKNSKFSLIFEKWRTFELPGQSSHCRILEQYQVLRYTICSYHDVKYYQPVPTISRPTLRAKGDLRPMQPYRPVQAPRGTASPSCLRARYSMATNSRVTKAA